MKAPPPKPFITNYFKSNSAQEPTTWRNQMPRFPPLRIDPTVVFQRGRPGNYAVRYRRSCQMPTTKFRVNLVEQFRYAGCGLTMADCTDSLTYHSLENYSVPLRNWLNFQPCNGDPQLNPPVRVCSYNVLCQPTIEKTKYLYRHLDGRNTYLRWEYRWSLMKRELFQLQADIFCLQEVFYLHYQTEFLLLFERMGYVGRYERKNGGSMDVHDGCAIFYRRDVFEEIHYRPVRMYANENCALDKPNIGQVIRLRHLTTGRELCVANTHLIFNTKSGHRKFAQLALLLAHLKAVCEMRNPRYHTQARVEYILCGDFNIEPFSDIYRFVIEKQLNLDFCRLKEMSGQGERDNSMGVTIDLPREVGLKTNCTFAAPGERYSVLDRTWTHDLNFASSYFHLKTDHQHDLSTFHSRQGLNPDIIFYSVNQTYVNEEDSTLQVQEGGLRLLRRLELPDISEATTIIGPWPNKHTPSDHVPLLVEFAFV
ncbi:hypothetical protein L596_028489 [Steinernema carpocapsae]|uniref:Endonuclease/exonuclease/phosphatase domain-containing protein n=1 Tax=Steinernema carpocapsae TaxID=34508 RepID=A0A4U5LYL4_STECR|nr:hypothetical protein L596_028489 [Steinernema carpocapsae]